MATILISFIGTGQTPRDDKQKEFPQSRGKYLLGTYKFDHEGQILDKQTTVFGSALLSFLVNEKKRDVRKWLVMGTPQSNWCDLVEVFSEDIQSKIFDENGDLWAKLDDEAKKRANSKISQTDLDAWQDVLSRQVEGIEIICRLVGTAVMPDSQEKIFESLFEVIENDTKVVFDVTHGLRNQPIITSFVLMYLRWLRNIKTVEFYYGAFELGGEVVKLDFCQNLLEATEAFATFQQTGNFTNVGKCLKLDQENLETVVFANEMNRSEKGAASKLVRELAQNSANFNSVEKSLEPLMKKSLAWQSKSIEAVYQEKAAIAFEHKQYFQAIALLWEALLLAACKSFNIPNPTTFKSRREAEIKINEELSKFDRETFQIIDYLRNAVMHGTDVEPSKVESKVKKAIKNPTEFQIIFKKGQNLFKVLMTK